MHAPAYISIQQQGVLFANSHAHAAQGPPPGFAGPAEQAPVLNGSTSSFPSFSSDSSMSAAQEALTAAINAPVPMPAAQKPNGSMQWDAPPPAANVGTSSNIWGTANNVS